MQKKKIFSFNYSLVSLLISAFISSNLSASTVRNDIDYQYFRDFAENKGLFTVGAMNIPIFDKQGKHIGFMLENAPMHDFSSITHEGWATLTAPQFITTAAHNNAGRGNFGSLSFAATVINPDNHTFNYVIANAAIPPQYKDSSNESDYQVSRLHKLVTEVVPVDLFEPGFNAFDPDYKQKMTALFSDKTRFSQYLRAGGGLQHVVNKGDTKLTIIPPPDPYRFLTGGIPPQFDFIHPRKEFWTKGWIDSSGQRIEGSEFFYINEGGPMKNFGSAGDSGSGLVVYDTFLKKWVLIGEIFGGLRFNDKQHVVANWTIVRPEFNTEEQKKASAGEITTNGQAQRFIWQNHGTNSSKISSEDNQTYLEVGLATIQNGKTNYDTGKDVYFNGDVAGELVLKNDLNQGAGALYFNTNFKVEAENNHTWIGGGVVVADGKQVIWKINNPSGDRLSKLGKGTLLVQGVGKNLGDISVGEGMVILDQQANAQGEKQAFNLLGIVSGRPTVKLMSADQVSPNNIYFGFRGGRLDLNGHNMTFNKIAHSDNGATIVNHNLSNAAHLYIEDAVNLNLTQSTKWDDEADYYEMDNKLPNNYHAIYYFLPKTTLAERKRAAKGKGELPFWGESNEYWDYVGTDKDTAIKLATEKLNAKTELLSFTGFLGEPDENKPNGILNFTFQPKQNSTLSLAGGMNIKGDVNVKKGNLILSGDPTYHAYDHINKREVILDNDWQNRSYQAQNMNITNGASLIIGRNVTQARANFNADSQSNLTLGYDEGQTVCYRSHYSGDMLCKTPTYNTETLNTIPETEIIGDIRLNGESQLKLGKTHLKGQINGTKGTHSVLSKWAKWTLMNDSQLGNLTLQEGATINLYSSPQGKFNTLTIQDSLSGDNNATQAALFKFRVNLDQLTGDRIVVNGTASGSYLLDVNSIGEGKTNKEGILPLIELKGKNNTISASLKDKEYIDSGALRYHLEQDTYSIHLGNPLLTPEEQKRRLEEHDALDAEHDLTEEESQAEKQTHLTRRKRYVEIEQAPYLSTIGNTAVAEVAAQLNGSLKHIQSLSSQLLHNNKTGLVWTNISKQKTTHQSQDYRLYKQNLTYTEIGAESGRLSHDITLGGVLSSTNTSNNFYEGASEKVKQYQTSFYLKKYLSDRFFLGANIGYANSSNMLRFDEEEIMFNRQIFHYGINVGQTFPILGFDGKWLLSLQQYHLSGVNYTLNNIDVKTHSLNLTSYDTKLEFSKKFKFQTITVLPVFSIYYQYMITRNIENKVTVGNLDLKQNFGNTLLSQLGIDIEISRNWYISSRIGLGKGNNSKKEKNMGIKITYAF